MPALSEVELQRFELGEVKWIWQCDLMSAQEAHRSTDNAEATGQELAQAIWRMVCQGCQPASQAQHACAP